MDDTAKYLSLGGDAFSFAGGATTSDIPIPAWKIWEKASGGGADAYSRAMQDVVTIKTVQQFWRHWISIPQPSELLEGNKIVREDPIDGRTIAIDSLMIFRENVKPEWEDPANSTGGHFAFSIKPGAVSGSILPKDMITGIRLVDKVGSGKNSCVRIEVWFRNFSDTEAVQTLKGNVEAAMVTRLDGTPGIIPKCELKSHND